MIAGTEPVLLALAAFVGAMWLTATVAHALGYDAGFDAKPKIEAKPQAPVAV